MDLATDGIIEKSWKLSEIGPTWRELVTGSMSLMGISSHQNPFSLLHFPLSWNASCHTYPSAMMYQQPQHRPIMIEYVMDPSSELDCSLLRKREPEEILPPLSHLGHFVPATKDQLTRCSAKTIRGRLTSCGKSPLSVSSGLGTIEIGVTPAEENKE